MKAISFRRSRFKLKRFLAALHQFSLNHGGDGNPLPGVSGDIAYFDSIDLAEALASDEGEACGEIPDDSLARLEMDLPLFGLFGLFGLFAVFNGFDGFDCIDGQEVEVPNLDDEDEDDEPQMPRRRRTKKYLEAVENTVADENSSFGFLISLNGDKVEIEGRAMSDVSGDCELEPMAEPNLLSEAMKRWLKTFLFPKQGGKP